MSKLIDISAELCYETDNAYLLFDGRKTLREGKKIDLCTWVPKSMVEYDGKQTFTMPEWLALDKGFI